LKRTRSLTSHSLKESLTPSKPSSNSPGHKTARSARTESSEYGDFTKARASIQHTSVLSPTLARPREINSAAKDPMAAVNSNRARLRFPRAWLEFTRSHNRVAIRVRDTRAPGVRQR